ncbi:hypothetical protein CJ030_MR1G005390 [Morella rubra]|uniref:Uncharacterized protein n=1 Tax=Morella rubra TaxID=262757 RepID=A0A6A1WIQ8_9ROSI|nr:hypothetical protein CJ030_MR1G005397 [Morella rubra]KAB1225081.1 hypothetical protein CJ030_MR1G005390 [Morella rubra]
MSRIAATRSVPIVRQDLIIDVSQVREPAQWPDWIIDVSQVREPAQWPECCIYRVPKKLRNVNKDAYTPKLISIGPLHHGSEELKDMEKLKVRYFKLYCDRVLKGDEGGASTADHEKEVQLQKRLASVVAENSEKIRHCYAECPPLGDEEFVRMILVDATFIIELFLRALGDAEDHGNDYILSKPWLGYGIKQDLILLENQLPFFILEKIHEQFSMPVRRVKTDFLTLAVGCFSLFFDFDDNKKSGLTEVKHFTHLLRCLYCLPKPKYKRTVGHLNRSSEPDAVDLEGGESVDYQNSASKKLDKAGPNDGMIGYTFCAGVGFKRVAGRGLLEEELIKRSELDAADLEGGESVDHQNSASRKLDKASLNDGMVWNNLRSVSKLEEAGVEFKMVEGGLHDIEFKKEKILEWIPCLNCSWLLACLPCFKCFPCLVSMQPFLEVPQFVVDDSTETVFRNLMALEQCHYPNEAYICDYIVVLDYLIDTEKDVDLLVSKKIIVNLLGSSNAVASMINKLCEEIVDTGSCYYQLSEQLTRHCDNFWNHAMATLKSVYFANIWRGTATIIGLIVLGFTLWSYSKTYT